MDNNNRSKSKKVRFSTHSSRPTESLAPLDEEDTPQKPNENMSFIDMLATAPPDGSLPASQRSSTLSRRISSFFPQRNTEAKLPQEPPKQPVLRKQVPAQYTAAALITRQPAQHVVNKDSHATDQLPAEPPARLQKPIPQPQLSVEASNNPRVPISNPRVVSAPLAKKPAPHTSEDEASTNTLKKLRRKSKAFLGGNGSQSESKRSEMAVAWVIDGKSKVGYDITPLERANKTSELWDDSDSACMLVYLRPRKENPKPSFKTPIDFVFDSEKFYEILCEYYTFRINDGESQAITTFERNSAPITDLENPEIPLLQPIQPDFNPSDKNRYFYFDAIDLLSGPDTDPAQALIDARNLFAFFTVQPLVATSNCPTLFRIFMSIAGMLRKFKFGFQDGEDWFTYGPTARVSFDFYNEKYRLADVRHSREATLEGIILGEAMKSPALYNEAFTHAVGKWDDIKAMKSPLFDEISSITKNRLELSSRLLKKRLVVLNERLQTFSFPSIFAGIASSATADEAKLVRFKNWKVNYERMRKFFISYYITLHGQWPPKARSKKNDFTIDGMNRLVLQGVYDDLTRLYDYLVDRNSLSTRVCPDLADPEAPASPSVTALRKLQDEFDNSSPPVSPPIPYDVPLMPTFETIDAAHSTRSPTEKHEQNTRKLKGYQIEMVMIKSHNLDAEVDSSFLKMFKKFEEKESQGKNVQELTEQRIGHWIFLYAVIQSLPLLVADASYLKFTTGVEYYLCQTPMGVPPWIEETTRGIPMSLYEVKGTGGFTRLPDDVVNNGLEATFRRSHCWKVAVKWILAKRDGRDFTPEPTYPYSPLSPPPHFNGFGDSDVESRKSSRSSIRSFIAETRSQSSSPAPQPQSRPDSRESRPSARDSIALGLERVSATYEPSYTGSMQSPEEITADFQRTSLTESYDYQQEERESIGFDAKSHGESDSYQPYSAQMSKPSREEIAVAVERARSRREAYENQQGEGEGSSVGLGSENVPVHLPGSIPILPLNYPSRSRPTSRELSAPPHGSQPRRRPDSREEQQDKRDSVALGLEKVSDSDSEFSSKRGTLIENFPSVPRPGMMDAPPLPLQYQQRNSSIPRPASATTNTGATFDDILSKIPGQDDEKKGKKK